MAGSDRVCGECSLCCTVLRVDALRKLGGTPCVHLAGAGRGCAIHTTRPAICRGYRCAWLQGSFRDEDRPDRLGAVLDFQTRGPTLQLSIREAVPGAFDRSPRLQEIAEAQRAHAQVRITDVEDVLNPERPHRVLLPDGEEQRVAGGRITHLRDGAVVSERPVPWVERGVSRLTAALTAAKLRWLGSR